MHDCKIGFKTEVVFAPNLQSKASEESDHKNKLLQILACSRGAKKAGFHYLCKLEGSDPKPEPVFN